MRRNIAARLSATAMLGALITGGLAVPAHAAADLPDLKITASLDKDTAAEGDTVTVTVNFANNGKADARAVHVTGCCAGGVTDLSIVDKDVLDKHFDLPVGKTHSIVVRTTVQKGSMKYGYAAFSYGWDANNGEASHWDNRTDASLKVPGAKGSIFGLVYEAGSQAEPSTGRPRVPGVKVIRVDWDDPNKTYGEIVSDTNGEFLFTGVPAGQYRLRVVPPAGWRAYDENDTIGTGVRVVGDEKSQLVIPIGKAPVTPSPSPSATPSTAAPAPAPAPATPGLAVTGSKAAVFGWAGGAAVLAGVGLVLAARRRRRSVVS
ncbi:DUF11 domain-containing protein [Longispora albida]|uniref:DUF11 domain-containing protein n=1 Tax=Longispora albida TaxID=203523 RepID=UPI000376E2E6|nr:DUF11 domain-containing protein [Longispora albida]